MARELTRRRGDKFIPIKITNAHAKLEERLAFVRGFRQSHFQLRDTIVKVMLQPSKHGAVEAVAMDDINAVEDVDSAYDCVKNVDILDVTAGKKNFLVCVFNILDGMVSWVAAENGYNEKVSRVENQIITRLRDRLASAKNANEMFRVFSKFNALFVRPKVFDFHKCSEIY